MRCWVGVAFVVAVLATATPWAGACGGHEARAADCLATLFGDNHVSGSGDHTLTVTANGESMSVHDRDTVMVERLSAFLVDHGVPMVGGDPCDNLHDEANIFEDVNLAG
ncbi:MAG: hypothetical protein HYZ53_24570 [Planctomycetes bacterium]|nr:hypothetical protein [Planctomycetota bacterium]